MKKSLRFKVFRRDHFVCLYCGRHPPDVVLEVDHIVPRKDGGPDDLENLITACQDCNRGKGTTRIETGGEDDAAARATSLRERVAQAKAYHALVAEVEEERRRAVAMVLDEWGRAFHAHLDPEKPGVSICDAYWPDESSIRQFLQRLPLEEVVDAVHVAATKMEGRCGDSPRRYFYGVVHHKIRDRGASDRDDGSDAP